MTEKRIRIFESVCMRDLESDVNEFLENPHVVESKLTYNVIDHSGDLPSFVNHYVMVEYYVYREEY